MSSSSSSSAWSDTRPSFLASSYRRRKREAAAAEVEADAVEQPVEKRARSDWFCMLCQEEGSDAPWIGCAYCRNPFHIPCLTNQLVSEYLHQRSVNTLKCCHCGNGDMLNLNEHFASFDLFRLMKDTALPLIGKHTLSLACSNPDCPHQATDETEMLFHAAACPFKWQCSSIVHDANTATYVTVTFEAVVCFAMAAIAGARANKYSMFKPYADRHALRGGVVREDLLHHADHCHAFRCEQCDLDNLTGRLQAAHQRAHASLRRLEHRSNRAAQALRDVGLPHLATSCDSMARSMRSINQHPLVAGADRVLLRLQPLPAPGRPPRVQVPDSPPSIPRMVALLSDDEEEDGEPVSPRSPSDMEVDDDEEEE